MFPTQQQILISILSAIGTVPQLQTVIGAHDFLKSHNWLEFSFAPSDCGNRVRITYDFSLQYRIDFYQVNGSDRVLVKSFEGLTVRHLAPTFERATGYVLTV